MRRSKRRVPHRRKREGRTDYMTRLRLLKSGKPRFVVRRSLNSILCQLVKSDHKADDRTVASARSSELRKFGWKFHGGNLPSAYLTGFLCAEKAKRHKIGSAVMDMGLYEATPGNRFFSALKGAVDGGLDIPHSEEAMPRPERFTGKHIADYAEKLKAEDSSKYKKVFSGYVKAKVSPGDIQKSFEEAKKKIASGGAKRTKKKTPKKSKK